MRFKKYLKESLDEMSIPDAIKVFGIKQDEIADKDLIKKTYRQLAIRNHPDRGGSTQAMQDVNDAFATLSKASDSEIKSQTMRQTWAERDEKYRMAGAQIKTSLISNFKPEIFQAYFKEMSGFDYQYEMKKIYPTERDRNPSYAGFDVEFFTKDRNAVFTMKIHANLHDIVWPKAELGYGDLSYQVYTEAHGFYMNKKQKMSQKDWGSTRDHSFFRKPEQLFPRKKMTAIFSGKTSKRAFKKRDMEAFLSKKLQAKLEFGGGQTQAAIPLGDLYNLIIYRSVFFKQGTWSGIGIYKKKSETSLGYGQRVAHTGTWTFMEDEETAKIFEKIVKEARKAKGDAIPKKTNDLIKYAYDAYKKSRGL